MVCLQFGCFFMKYKQEHSWLSVPQDINPHLIPSKVNPSQVYNTEVLSPHPVSNE